MFDFLKSKAALAVSIVLLAATLPIAIIANAGRVTITGVLSEVNPELARGFFHELEGYVIFVIAFGSNPVEAPEHPSLVAPGLLQATAGVSVEVLNRSYVNFR